MSNQFDRKLFSASIQAKLIESHLSLREAAKESGMSLATLSRLANGKVPDIDNFAAAVHWLQIDAQAFMDAPKGAVMTNREKWSWLHLCLQDLDVSEELIGAIVTIIKLASQGNEAKVQ
jgi:transcriptional regulator with XRE-family HTH domain